MADWVVQLYKLTNTSTIDRESVRYSWRKWCCIMRSPESPYHLTSWGNPTPYTTNHHHIPWELVRELHQGKKKVTSTQWDIIMLCKLVGVESNLICKWDIQRTQPRPASTTTLVNLPTFQVRKDSLFWWPTIQTSGLRKQAKSSLSLCSDVMGTEEGQRLEVGGERGVRWGIGGCYTRLIQSAG